MVSFKTVLVSAALATAASARPTVTQLESHKLAVRQAGEEKGADMDLNTLVPFAGAAEDFERVMYRAVIEKCRNELPAERVRELESIQSQEETHGVVLQSALAQAGAKPIRQCTYDFSKLKDCRTALQIATIVESGGVSAYAAATSLAKSKDVLALATSILPVEAKHLTSVRGMQGLKENTAAFDSALDPASVATLLMPFIVSCPAGSSPADLVGSNVPLEMQPGQEASSLSVGKKLKLQVGNRSSAQKAAGAEAEAGAASAKFCAFPVSLDASASGVEHTPFSGSEGCEIPQGVAGAGFVFLVSQQSPDGKLAAENIVAGPMGMIFS